MACCRFGLRRVCSVWLLGRVSADAGGGGGVRRQSEPGKHLAVDAYCQSRAGKLVELHRRAAVSLATVSRGDFCEHG